MFGLFAICGFQFSPRLADITDSRLWRIDTTASYGPFDELGRHRVRLDRIRAHWPDMLRVAGSLTTGQVRAYDLIRMISRDGRPTGLGEAFAHYGRIFKTLHLLQVLHDESYRRMIGSQLNLHESRHALARQIRHGQHGQLREHYRQGMENQLGALGLVLNATVLVEHDVHGQGPRAAPGGGQADPRGDARRSQPADLRAPQLQRPLLLPPVPGRRATPVA